jgi:hypothetical protein
MTVGTFEAMVLRKYDPQKSPIATETAALQKPIHRRSTCSLRKYPPHRYFKLKERPLPSFLTKTKYIYGEFPTMLPVLGTGGTQKLCVDQSAWWTPPAESLDMLPFADGTNPSIVRIQNNRQLLLPVDFGPDAAYLATICMTNSQCAWKDTPEQIQAYHLSTQAEPSKVLTVLLVLDENFQVLEEVTIQTLLDADFGKTAAPLPPVLRAFPLDDARLFTYNKELWVSYRDGSNFGFEKQVLNRVHLTRDGSLSHSFQATLLASEVETLCCGRNMALLDNALTNKLHALTWVDPVTVVNVNIKEKIAPRRLSEMDGRRRLSSSQAQSSWNHSLAQPHRRMTSSNRKHSDFHGTNGFMVYLPQSREYLGIGHFHRPPGRKVNGYARFGHHYTHAFFTISDHEPFHLKRLSPELVLSSDAYPQDAEIIQFWSGLELLDNNKIALAYGINDCEGAATYIDMGTIEALLRDVTKGQEVSDLLQHLKEM